MGRSPRFREIPVGRKADLGHTDVRRKIEPVEEFALNEEEQSLIRNWRTLSPEERECILTVMRTISRK